METFDCIVCGCGGVGSSVLYHLARQKVKVLGLDPFPPGHRFGSTHGHTRVIRLAYMEHPDYVPLLKRAYDLWHEFEEESGASLYEETGVLQVGPADGSVIPGILKSAEEHDLEVEQIDAEGLVERFPGFVLEPKMKAIFERRAGFLHAKRAWQLQTQLAQQEKAQLSIGEHFKTWTQEGKNIVVETSQRKVATSRLLLSLGPWIPRWAPSHFPRLTITRQTSFWYCGHGPYYHMEAEAPVFLYETPEGVFYGLPHQEPWGVKVARHSLGTPIQHPQEAENSVDPEEESQVRSFLKRYLPKMDHTLRRHEVCRYTNTPDGHFVIDQHPEAAGVFFLAGLSGHGFKFAPVLGEQISLWMLEGRPKLSLDFLSLRRFSQV
ncbi:N-methyl-L-tryptophan oxidase [Planctomycetales bacterium 10988]|nr:N-methyl-L-tryptophan oxidase [Planctomycetales bacterium 10988]